MAVVCEVCRQATPMLDEGEMCPRMGCPYQPDRYVAASVRRRAAELGLSGDRVVWLEPGVRRAPAADWERGGPGREAAENARLLRLAGLRQAVDVAASRLKGAQEELAAAEREGEMPRCTAAREFRVALDRGDFDTAGIWLRRMNTWAREERVAAGAAMAAAIDGALREEREDQAFGPAPSKVVGKIDTSEVPAASAPVMKERVNELVHAIEHLCGRVSIDDAERGFLLRRFKDWNTCDREAWAVLRAHIGLRTRAEEYPPRGAA